jgi:hypothetical protein
MLNYSLEFVSLPLIEFDISSDGSWDGVVGIATGYGLDDRWVGILDPVGSKFSLLHVVQTGSGVHPTSCPMGTESSFPRGKAAGA